MTKPAVCTTVEHVTPSNLGASIIRAAIVTGPGGNPNDDSISCRVFVPHGTDFDADSVPTLAEGNDHSPFYQLPGGGFVSL